MEQHPKPNPRWTVKGVLDWTARYFATKEVGSARIDAEVLLAHCLGKDRLYLYLNLDRPLSLQERERYRELVRRRAQREPVALIVGSKEFWSIQFKVAPGVLIPRPDTEILVEVVLEEIRAVSDPRVMEIGTGSGAVAVSILRENSIASVVATDIDAQALRTALLNAREADVASAFDCVASDIFSAICPGEKFDVICSNPPYIPTRDIQGLEPEITKFEPLRALDGGIDGLDVIRRIAQEARNYLKDHGAIIFEVGDGQADSVADILSDLCGCRTIRKFLDLSGKQRVVKGKP
jgi:release factor glutamine methyltransferase